MNHVNEIINSPWYITRNAALAYLKLYNGSLGLTDKTDYSEQRQKDRSVAFVTGVYNVSEYGEYASPEDAPENSIAVVGITGAITEEDQMCGPAGMKTKASILQRLDANPKVKSIVLKINSPGGSGYAARFMAQQIQKIQKPIVAFIENLGASAAYYIASATDRIIANDKLAQIGSIGTYITLIDDTGYFEKEGFRIIEIYASKSTEKNQDYLKAIDPKNPNPEPLRQKLDVFNQAFLDFVAEQRGFKKEDEWSNGGMWFAPEAEAMGLIDEISTIEEVLESLDNL